PTSSNSTMTPPCPVPDHPPPGAARTDAACQPWCGTLIKSARWRCGQPSFFPVWRQIGSPRRCGNGSRRACGASTTGRKVHSGARWCTMPSPREQIGAPNVVRANVQSDQRPERLPIMATDYDAPRKTEEDLSEDSLEELKARRADKNSSVVDEDEAEAAEGFELPGADLSGEELSVRVVPRQADEFTCSQCFLVHHRSQLAYEKNGLPVCSECAA